MALSSPGIFSRYSGRFYLASHSSYQIYAHKLSKGWIFNRQIDNSDSQYSSFRQNIPVLIAVVLIHQIVSKIVNWVSAVRSKQKETLVQHHEAKFPLRLKWSLLFSIIFITALFGSSSLKILLIISAHYRLIKWKPRLTPYITWIFGISILFLNDYYQGYKFGSISSYLSFLDNFKGVGMRWNITFNFTILRMISFSMDYFWALTKSRERHASFYTHSQSCLECQSTSTLCKRQRLEKPHSVFKYHYWNYLAYCLYAPLFMAGPILPANDFLHQIENPPKTISNRSTILYTARWLGAVLIMEVMMHYLYVVAIKDAKAWKDYAPMELYLVGFFNLKLIWLKLLIIWRFFRAWAMNDGIETVENMGRCMSNHYSGVDFWREWHTSFNRWLVRYLYVPLGGSRYKGINMFPIFSFVAIWHDIEGRLLAWGWLIALFILPEMFCHAFFKTDMVNDHS